MIRRQQARTQDFLTGKIVVEEDKLLEVWKEHYDRISNEEFSWDGEGLTDVRPVCGPGEKISEEEVGAAIGKMKLGKAGGPSGVVADMLKANGDEGTRWMTELCNAVVRDGKIAKDWSRSWLVNVYKGRCTGMGVIQRNNVGRTCHEGS